jgi:hypothetical protein
MTIVSDEFDFLGSVCTEAFSEMDGYSLEPVEHRDIQRIEWRTLWIFSAQKCSGN